MSRTNPDCSLRDTDQVPDPPDDWRTLLSCDRDAPFLGSTVGSYRLVKLLGKGGMGAVFLAEHPIIGSRVAIKFLHPQYARDGGIVERFFNEARAVNLIGHDNIVKVLDLAVAKDGRHYFVMEFLDGPSLRDLMVPGQLLSLGVVGPVLLQCCEALQAAHDRGIVHRDLKPENVHLTVHKGRKNFVKLLDFGIAKLIDGSGQSTGQTRTGTLMGTPAYMSPEQASGTSSRVDGRSDQYSLGVLMFQMATGRLPFAGDSFGDQIAGHLHQPPPRPSDLVPGIAQEYERIILRCLAKRQDARYASMRDLHDALESCMRRFHLDSGLPLADRADGAARKDAPAGGASPQTEPFFLAAPPMNVGRVRAGRRLGGKLPARIAAASAVFLAALLAIGYVAGARKAHPPLVRKPAMRAEAPLPQPNEPASDASPAVDGNLAGQPEQAPPAEVTSPTHRKKRSGRKPAESNTAGDQAMKVQF